MKGSLFGTRPLFAILYILDEDNLILKISFQSDHFEYLFFE